MSELTNETAQHRWWRRRKERGGIDLAVDTNGDRYTTRCFATDDDPWRGALILTPTVVHGLRERNLLPLTEVVSPTDYREEWRP